jgi:hypothetical protein
MKDHSRLYLIVFFLMLVAMLLPQSVAISATRTLAGSTIPFSRHIVGQFYGNGAHSVYATDVDGDGDVDVVGAGGLSPYNGEIAWWENDGSGGFTKQGIDDHFIDGSSVYATDVDRDGDVDILGAASGANDITWWENDGSQNFIEHIIDSYFSEASSVYAIDVDGDGDVDVLGAASGASDITWWENDGSQNFIEHTIDSYFSGASSVYATDVDGDGDVDVLGTAKTSDDITWWENDGSQNFIEHIIDSYFDSARSVYATDMDSDGDVDVLGAASGASEITWWENDGGQNFTEHTIDGDFRYAWSVYAIDVDGDEDIDVLGAGDDDLVWWENDGSQNFTGHTVTSACYGAESVYATDVDGDGDVDVLGAADHSYVLIWCEQGSVPPSTVASFPFYDGFESGTLGTDWMTYTTYEGRVRVSSSYPYGGTYSLLLDDFDRDSTYSYAAAILTIDLSGQSEVELDFWWCEFNDESDPDDGVFISDDGANWHPVLSFNGETSAWRQAIIDIDAAAAVNGLTLSDHFQIKFQFYDDDPIDYDGYAIDEVRVHRESYRLYLPVVLKNAGRPSAPVLDPIDNPDGDGSYTVSWGSVSGATEYVLQEDDNDSFASPTEVYRGPSTSTTITGRDVGTYYYRVQATNSFGSSPWSNVVSVQVTQSPTPTPTPKPKTWVNVINHCSCTVFVDFTGPETKSVTVFANSTSVVFLTPGTYHYDIDSIGCGSASGFVTIPHAVQFDFHIRCSSSLDTCPTEVGEEGANCATIQLVR